MLLRVRSLLGRLHGWLLTLPLAVAVGIVLVVTAGVGTGSYYAYRTYDWVEHDNDFCMSCHLMAEPYERFAESAHRGLGCKACHQPTLLGRSQMALTQVVENPDELSVHADVPNEVCTACHVDGDPDTWRLIASSAGHRIHLESDDPALAGVECVGCHSSALHEFAPVDRTCAQSGCHEDSEIRLGAMSELTIHCAACHDFVRPLPASEVPTGELAGTMMPAGDECFSCHVMRALVAMPDPDPHGGVCASCHNPHTQEIPAEAVGSCASAGCHERADTLTPMHRGLPPGAYDRCLDCHGAHDFTVDAEDCVACHAEIYDDSVGAGPPISRRPGEEPGSTIPALRSPDPSGYLHGVGSTIPALRSPHSPGYLHGVGAGPLFGPLPAQEPPPSFRHSEHRDVSCVSCHSSADSHGAVTVATVTDCRSCHHTEPLSASCDRCHGSDDAPRDRSLATRELRMSVGTVPARALPFEHATHAGVPCATCHTDGLALDAAATECRSCHADHHQPDSRCTDCHVAAPVAAHPPAEAHLTCSGAGCHAELPFDVVPRTREVCLACHQELRDHRPERPCAECHVLPAPRGGSK